MEPGITIGIIGLIIGLVSLVLTYIFYSKNLRIKVPLFTIESRGPLGGIPEIFPELTLKYKDEDIKFFTVSRVAIWNGGKDTIYSKDMVKSDPIRIIAEDGYKFLKAEIKQVLNSLNNFQIFFSPKEILLNFDYMDYREGCCIEIRHNGKTSWALQVLGSVIGAGKIKHAKHIHYPMRRKRAYLISTLTFILGSLISFLIFGWENEDLLSTIIGINFFVAFVVYAFAPMIISSIYFRRNMTSLELGVADDDERLRAPDFPPTGRVRERDKDADPFF